MLPKPYTVPTEGPTGRYLEAIGQHPWRPAHIHFKVSGAGPRTLVTQLFFPDDPYLENDTIGRSKPALVRRSSGAAITSAATSTSRSRRPGEPVRELRPGRAGSRRWSTRTRSGRWRASRAGRQHPCVAAARSAADRRDAPAGGGLPRPVVPSPGKIVCVGLSYKAHVDEGVQACRLSGAVPEVRRDAGGRGRGDRAAAGVEAVDYDGACVRRLAHVRRLGARRRWRRWAAARSPATSRCATTSTSRTSGWRARRGLARHRSARSW